FLHNQARVAVRQQIINSVSDGIKAPDTLLKAVALYRGEDRTVEYIVLPRSLVEPIEEPTDDALSTWFEKEKKNYTAPEYRKFSYVRLEPTDIADPASISDEQVRQDYDAHKSRY